MNTRKARAIIAIGADNKQLDKDLKEARKKLKAFRAGAKKIGSKLLGGISSGAKFGLGGVVAGLGIGAAGGLSEMVTDLIGFEKSLTRFQIATGKSAADMAAFKAQILGVATATGVAQSDILTGAQTYVDLTGDVKGAETAMSTFARVAQASGASVSDIATASAALQQSLGIDAKDLEATFSGMISQGKAGAVSLKDFASELSAIAPRWAKFNEGSTVEGVAQLGAAFQVARQGFGSASEAATGLEALMGAITLNAKKFQAAGVKIFDKDPKTGAKRLRTFDQVINSIGESKLMKDPTALTKAFGSKEAEQAFTMLNRAKNSANGAGDAVSRTANAYQDLVDAGKDTGAVGRDLKTFLESPAGRLEKMFVTLKASISEAFTPERIQKFVEALGKIIEFIPKVVEGMIAIGSATDTRRVAGEMLGKDIVTANAGLTPEQKRAKAQEFMRQAQRADEGSGEFHAAMYASRELMQQSDAWNVRGGGGGGTPADPAAIGRAVANALQGGLNINLQVGAETIATAVANAPNQRRKRGR
jgi:TP901 family phage tail tape measure protein